MTTYDDIVRVTDLGVTFGTYAGDVHAVRGASFTVRRGETLAILGESGSGKSVTAKALMRLLPGNARVTSGELVLDGVQLLDLPERDMEEIRGGGISMVFQDPMTSLNPTMKLGKQIVEAVRQHSPVSAAVAKERALELLRLVGIPNREQRFGQYPHQLSGGMRQRVVIAIALAREPQVLIADEPTTALDVTIQAQILELLMELQDRLGMAIVLITHDLGVVAETADRVAVMYAGKVVETGTVHEIFGEPKMPYTWGLLRSLPSPDSGREEDLTPIPGSPPDPTDPPAGCPYAPRCAYAMRICDDEFPDDTVFSGEHRAACWLHHPLAPPVEPPVFAGGAQ